MDVAIAVPLGFFTMVAVIVVGSPLARAYARKVSNQSVPPAIPPEVQQRLEHMEQAIDSIAVEVERISEGQRFTTKLLAERNPEAHAALSASERERR
ncbi:MAG TPA: hypothetical protein VFR95_04030 [Gemmatimonadaceae bacterium]|nr:hypothetical protein [Gemmatimonadaceae bacterium]